MGDEVPGSLESWRLESTCPVLSQSCYRCRPCHSPWMSHMLLPLPLLLPLLLLPYL